ncbi:MAG: HNH endonuclease signature motif containing protein [Ilumatobacter sp.]|uniref:HNH endonuclease signature motif containing protein n=1 Tax=Ilumatobacter sp. TaxID=1967498 RepID=UPI00391BF255
MIAIHDRITERERARSTARRARRPRRRVRAPPHRPLDALALAGGVRRAVVDSQSVVIDLGRRQRLFAGSARAAAKLVVRHCEHPGCELPADWCEVDHMVEWGDHGATAQRNAALECDGHNRAKHRRRWRTRRNTEGRLVTHRADGTMMRPVGVRPPALPSDDEIGYDAGDAPEDIARSTALVRQRVLAPRSA